VAQYQCEVCGAAFARSPTKTKRWGRFLCSRQCAGVVRRTQRLIECAICGTAYFGRAERPSRFCSRPCRDEARRTPRIPKICEYCQQSFVVNTYRQDRARFCSHACRAKALSVGRTIGVRAVVRVSRPTPYEKAGYRKLAAAVRKRDGYRCQLCARQFERGMRGLEIDHRVPIRSGGLDTPDNLWALCSRCHRRKDSALRMSEL